MLQKTFYVFRPVSETGAAMNDGRLLLNDA